MHIYQLDHLVLTVADLEKTCHFYGQILQIPIISFGEGRKALQLGNQKVNLHQVGKPIAPHAQFPCPGSADLCLLTDQPIEQLAANLQAQGVEIIAGPVERTGACTRLWSIYIRDPDQNLIELANSLANSTLNTSSLT